MKKAAASAMPAGSVSADPLHPSGTFMKQFVSAPKSAIQRLVDYSNSSLRIWGRLGGGLQQGMEVLHAKTETNNG